MPERDSNITPEPDVAVKAAVCAVCDETYGHDDRAAIETGLPVCSHTCADLYRNPAVPASSLIDTAVLRHWATDPYRQAADPHLSQIAAELVRYREHDTQPANTPADPIEEFQQVLARIAAFPADYFAHAAAVALNRCLHAIPHTDNPADLYTVINHLHRLHSMIVQAAAQTAGRYVALHQLGRLAVDNEPGSQPDAAATVERIVHHLNLVVDAGNSQNFAGFEHAAQDASHLKPADP